MTSLPHCVVIGGGDHARTVIDGLRSAGLAEPVGILDPRRSTSDALDGVPVLGGDDVLTSLADRGITAFAVGVGGVGDNGPRRATYLRAVDAGLTPLTVVHPRAVIADGVVIGRGSFVAAGVVVNVGVVAGENVILNTGALVDHDCVLGDHVHVSPGAILCGAVRVGTMAHVGAGAVVRQHVSVGDGAVVGIGAAVVADVPGGSTVVGVPAREARQ
jgi:UDP-perosamine 4-acetyltransferase